MNWRRGLFRLWAVSSIAWIAVVFVVVNPIQKIGDPIAAAAYEDKSKPQKQGRQATVTMK